MAKLIFCMQISMKACWKLILWFLWGRSSIPKVPKVPWASKFPTRWYYRNGFHFLHRNQHRNFYKLALSFLMEMAWRSSKYQNKKLVIFLQYVNCFCVLLWWKIFSNFSGVQSCSLLLVTTLQQSTEQLF